MGFFSKSNSSTKPAQLHECKLCREKCDDDFFIADLGICNACGVVANRYLETYFFGCLKTFEEKANKATNPEIKIHYLGAMLEILYEYKIKYQDNDIHLINGGVTEQIEKVIDCISHAREP